MDRGWAAYAWEESVTEVAEAQAEDESYRPGVDNFSGREISDVTLAIGLMK
ncbi:hypothetical protein [Salmonella enterica]|uniref:hypothetical protein n=1 Tax=Salmonella enterica TaxID=28901 RepID=UPI00398C7F70